MSVEEAMAAGAAPIERTAERIARLVTLAAGTSAVAGTSARIPA
jgi:hypothetical protein